MDLSFGTNFLVPDLNRAFVGREKAPGIRRTGASSTCGTLRNHQYFAVIKDTARAQDLSDGSAAAHQIDNEDHEGHNQ